MAWRRFILNTALLLSFCSTAVAELPAEVVNDFAPISGVVLLSRGGETLLDLTAEQGVAVGDLFSVGAKGDVVTHPQTGESLGTLNEVVAVLQLVQLRPDFSIAKQIDGEPLEPGNEIRRFDQISARFFDSSKGGEHLFIELREELPHLQWQNYTRIDAAELTSLHDNKRQQNGLSFFYDGQFLEVRDPEAALLHSYAIDSPAESARAAAPQPAEKIPTGGARVLTPKAKWLGAGAKGLPTGLAAADFDGDGLIEMARTFEDRLEIGRLADKDYETLSTHKFSQNQTAIAVSALDLNSNGRPELFVTTVVEDEVRGEVLEFIDGRFEVIARNQPWFFNTIILPGQGIVLLGQKRDRSHSGFSTESYQLEWQEYRLKETEPFTLSEQSSLYSLAPLPSAGKNRFARINSGGHIEVYGKKDGALWVSSEMGHSETSFMQADAQNPNFDEEFLHRVFLPTPLISGPENTILTAMNSGRTGFEKYRQMQSVTLAGWQWQDQDLQPLWQIAEMGGYVPAMTIADADNDGIDELILLIAHPNKGFFDKRKSVIKLFNLQ